LLRVDRKEKQPRITNRRIWFLKTFSGLINVVCVTDELSGKARRGLRSVDSEVWIVFLRQVNNSIATAPEEWKVICCWNTLWVCSAIACVSATTAQWSVPKVGSSAAEELVHIRVTLR